MRFDVLLGQSYYGKLLEHSQLKLKLVLVIFPLSIDKLASITALVLVLTFITTSSLTNLAISTPSVSILYTLMYFMYALTSLNKFTL
jgi:hypothetical protein